jgi:hypothetical protein
MTGACYEIAIDGRSRETRKASMKRLLKLTVIAFVGLAVGTSAIEAETAATTPAPPVDTSAGKWKFPGFKPGESYPDVAKGKVTGEQVWNNILDELEKYERGVSKTTIDWMRQNPPNVGEDLDAYLSRAPAPEL